MGKFDGHPLIRTPSRGAARAVVLFGDRIPDGTLRPNGNSRSLPDGGDMYDAVLDLADRIGVNIVMGTR